MCRRQQRSKAQVRVSAICVNAAGEFGKELSEKIGSFSGAVRKASSISECCASRLPVGRKL
jgi:hypothetical protein